MAFTEDNKVSWAYGFMNKGIADEAGTDWSALKAVIQAMDSDLQQKMGDVMDSEVTEQTAQIANIAALRIELFGAP